MTSPTGQDSGEFLIVAIGASAGGLEACETFFKHMPADAGIAFVLVMHLAPDHESALAELLGRHTAMAMEQVRHDTKVVANHVYIIPPNATLTIKDGVLQVVAPTEPRGHRTPIDSLFLSLAEDRGEQAVCIMLSGTGTDGTLGLRAIKDHGGMAMVQTLESAKYDAILRSAISTGLVDYVLPVAEMPEKLLEQAAKLKLLNGKLRGIRNQLGDHISKIHLLLRREAGHDFSQYKESTIARRIERRLKALQLETVAEYVAELERHPEEATQLFKDLLIGVTHFFRNPEAFAVLGRDIVPKLFAGQEGGGQVRVGVVGCSSGQEAYSLAILLSEHAATLRNAPKIQIFATDIDERALETARKGRYPLDIAEHVSADRLHRFFSLQDDGYHIKRELRDLCIFSTHSFIKDPPFSRLDLISCRNVMIYLDLDLQQKIIPLFHYALRPGGYLFLGPAENVSSHQELFRTVDKKVRVFQRKETLTRPEVRFPLGTVSGPSRPPVAPKLPVAGADERNLPQRLERVILERYGPSCVVVKETGEVVYFSGRISRYLEHPAGSPESNIIYIAREGLRLPLRTSLHRAVSAHERVVQRQIVVQTNGSMTQVDLTVEPLTAIPGANLFAIVVEDVAPLTEPGEALSLSDTGGESTVRYLESELRSAQEQAQAAYEELESSNEELQSSNEEYQSTNEELETAKEELQSINEELETVNAELNRRVEEFDRVNSDLRNLLDSTQIATLFLDSDLRIKAFTPAAGTVFSLIATDVGRPIVDLSARVFAPNLAHDIREVLRTLVVKDQQLSAAEGRYFQMRILPYRTVHNVIDGVVITFTDVTPIRLAQREAEDAKAYGESIISTVREPLVVLDADLRVQVANASFYATFDVSPADTVNTVLYELGNGQWDIPQLRLLLGELLPEKGTMEDFQVAHHFPGIGVKTMLLNARRLRQKNGSAPLILLAIEDITERTLAQESMRESEARLRFMAESMPQKIFTATPDGSKDYFNGEWMAFTGRSAEQLLDGGWKQIVHPADLEETARLWQHSATNGEAFQCVNRFLRADGAFRWHLTRALPMRDSSGNVSMWIGSNTEIHEQKETQEALLRANANLEHFAYSASHDLQEPLRSISIYSELLSRRYATKLDGQGIEFLSNLRTAAARMEHLIRDLLAYAQASREDDLVAEATDANAVFAAVLENLADAIEKSGAQVTAAPLPLVRVQSVHLQQLIQNIVGNAMKYQGGKQPHISLSAEREGAHWLFCIRDNGIGIAPEYKEQIFGLFKRLHTEEEYTGTGLGLAICQRIVERYGGRIWVESELGSGSTFFFTLPA